MNEGHWSDAKWSPVLACLFHLISVRDVHLPSFATTFGFPCSFSSCFNKSSSAIGHRYIKQVNPDRHSDRLLIPRFYWLGVTSMSSMLFSGREQIVRDLGLNRIIVICIVWCHFLEVSMNSVAGIKLHRIWRPEILDETQLIARSPQSQETSFPRWRHKSIRPRSPVARLWTRTSQLQTFVVSRGFDGFTLFFF